tara:strand:- start:54075 stop:54317 length:243 start_codon:yes stop_codon:yes gene_type:complete
MGIFIIHTQDSMLLSKKAYESWKEIQDHYPDYMASLGPWSAEEVIDYLHDEYSDLSPEASIQVKSLIDGKEECLELVFRN